MTLNNVLAKRMKSGECFSQEKLVLIHMRQQGGITPITAMNKYGILRLSAVIFRLKKKGHEIVTFPKKLRGKTIAEYRLEPQLNIGI